MDNSQTKVPLPSATESEQQTVFEKQTITKAPQVVSSDNKNVKDQFDTQSVHSESDNEGVSGVIETIDAVDKVINKSVDVEFDNKKQLLETDIDKIDEEVIEILREKSVERDEKFKNSQDDATSKNIANENIEKKIDVDATIEDEKIKTVKEDTKIIEEKSEKIEDEKIIEKLHEEKVEHELTEKKQDEESSNKKVEEKVVPEIPISEEAVDDNKEVVKVESKIEEENSKETLIDEDLLPKGALQSYIAQSAENNKPPVPIQTYLWEDVKRAKEQGGYPWTHLYKGPLGEKEEPEVILNYDRSPKSGRRSQPETPKSQKKQVRIQEEVETHEANSELPTDEIIDTEATSEDPELETVESKENQPTEAETADVKKSPKSILKKSQKLIENIKPNTSKFDSDSLKRKIKSPLQKIKKMADNQISKVKIRSSIKKIPIAKDEIVLNEKVDILKLKESPKSQHREFPAFIVKQDSDDTIDILDLEQSPSESRKQRLIESGIVTPDEIIDLPVSTDNNSQETDSCKKVEEKESHELEQQPYEHKHSEKEMSPTTVIIHKRKEHIYEEIDDFISKISSDSEHVDRAKFYDEKNPHDENLNQKDNASDPMFDEFSHELNKRIRKSLSAQDDSIRHELMKKIPKIEELEKQISDEDRDEKISEACNKDAHSLVPLSSIDSTTSDEIIDLPASDDKNEAKEIDSSKKEDKKGHQPYEHKHSDKEMSPTTVIIHKRKGHIYEEIDDFISKISFDSEHVDRVKFYDEKNPHDENLKQQDNASDPMFDEFSHELNKRIRKSLSAQDDSIRHELMRRIPKIEELEKQISDEDREEKVEHKNTADICSKNIHLLAPISSIDSTSSDEERRAQLSIVAEESETSDSLMKKKSFESEPSVDIHDVESLKADDSDVSTLIDDIKTGNNLENKEKDVESNVKIDEPRKDLDNIEIDESHKEVVNEKSDESQNEVTSTQIHQTEGQTVIEKADESIKEQDIDKPKEKSPHKIDEQSFKEDVDIKANAETPAPIKINPKWSKMSDHEYEPIGEPMLNESEAVDESVSNDKQKRKNSDSLEHGNEKKLLRSPSDESEDNISAQDFQDQIESRFFRKEIEPISDSEDQKHPEEIIDEAVIIDETPVVRDVPKKKSFMESAQSSGKNFQKKIKAQASSIKTSLNNKMKRKPKETPVAVEIAHVEKDDEPQAEENVNEQIENVEPITVNVQEAEEEASKSKKSKMSQFTKNIKKPTMPKFKKPQFKKPEIPKMPDLKVSERIHNLRKLGRSKSMKESSNGDSTSLNTPEVVSAEPTTKKKFDFGTYPRMIRDKFKRPKLPERSDASMISDSPAPDEDFNRVTQSFAQRGPVASRWPEYIEEESGKYQHFDSETDLDKEHLEFEREEIRHLMTDEQRQLDDMDRENLQIHLMAKQDKFRKPHVESPESDVASEDDKLMWSGMLNKNVKEAEEEEEEFEQNALRYDDDYKFTLDAYNNQELIRSSTPQTNQETQSSGSSGIRRRKGFLDDDEEYFMREQRISNKTQDVGDYIDSAIKEGLSSPDENALTQIGSYDEIERDNHELTPEKPTRSLKRKKKSIQNDDDDKIENEPMAFDYYKTYPPHRPARKDKKSISIEPDDDIHFQHDMPDDSSDILNENDMETFKGIEHPDLAYLQDDFDNDLDYNVSKLPVPPTPPRRRKKKIRGIQPHGYMSLRNEHLTRKPLPDDHEETIVYRQEINFVPLAQEEHFTTPTPTPRRTRSRSQISGYTLDDAESFKKDSVDRFNSVNVHDNKENDYAIIKKETPSIPVRRKRSTKSLGDKQFATLPLMPRRSEMTPPRPPRNYSTISHEKPDKPPRRKSAGSLVEISKTIKKDDDYEEILDTGAQDNRLSQRLKSGDIVSKMKDRPLPPPPRPKRESKKPKKDNLDDEKFDKDDGDAERIIEPLTIDVDTTDKGIETEPTLIIESIQTEPAIVEEKIVERDGKFLPRQESDFSEPERPIEVEVSTQTDPLPYDEFAMDDEDVDIEEFMGSDGKIKTLEDILKEEQEAELERARQLAEAENLSRGIQRFRENSQRSMSERSRTSADRSKSLSRPITPSAVVVERKKSSPIVFEKQQQIMTEAGLFIHPITYDDFGIQHSEDIQPVSPAQEPSEEVLDVNNNLEAEQNVSVENETAVSPEPDYDEIIKQAQLNYAQEDDEELDAEMQRKIEEMIESVMNTAREEAEWIKNSKENVQDDDIDMIQKEVDEPLFTKIVLKKPKPPAIDFDNEGEQEEPPLPPPRRKSNIDESILKNEAEDKVSVKESDNIEEQKITEQSITKESSAEKTDYENETLSDIQQLEPQEEVKEQQIDDSQLEISQAVSEDRPSSPFPSRLHLSSLEIDSLSVSTLQAGRITASEIDSHSIVTNEFESKSTNLPGQTVQIELPPGLIDEIVERVRNAERSEMQALHVEQQRIAEEQKLAEEQRIAEQQKIAELEKIANEKRILEEQRIAELERITRELKNAEDKKVTEEKVSKQLEQNQEDLKQEESTPPERPPLPEEYTQTTTQLQSYYQLKDASEGEDKTKQQATHHHRRRKYQPKKKDSTSDDDYQREQRPRSRAGTSNDQSVASLGGQFLRACGNSLFDSGNQLMEILRASSKDENNRDLHVALIILIVIVAGLFLMGTGEKSVHHHHWDFFNPPENQGR